MSGRVEERQACVILAGGASRRFGTPKGLALLKDKPVTRHALDCLRAQTSGPVALNAPLDSPYIDFGFDTLLPDLHTGGCGPLAGIHAAMMWAKRSGFDTVLTVAVDTPFLPADLVTRLAAAPLPAVAASEGRTHGVCGLWPAALAEDLSAFLEGGEKRVMAWLAACAATPVAFEGERNLDPFLNINTEDDLRRAEALLEDRD